MFRQSCGFQFLEWQTSESLAWLLLTTAPYISVLVLVSWPPRGRLQCTRPILLPEFLTYGYETSDVLQGADSLNACGEILLVSC